MALPTSLEGFQPGNAAETNYPQAAIRLWFDAVFVYLSGNEQLGEELITAMTKDKHWKRTASYFVRGLTDHPHIFRSYARGAMPENDYTMDPGSYKPVAVRADDRPYPDRERGDCVKVWLTSSGADSPRPIELQRNARGEYKVSNFSSIAVGVRPPRSDVAARENF